LRNPAGDQSDGKLRARLPAVVVLALISGLAARRRIVSFTCIAVGRGVTDLGRVVTTVEKFLQRVINFAVAGLGQLPALAESLRIVQVLTCREEVGVVPDGVSSGDSAFLLSAGPH